MYLCQLYTCWLNVTLLTLKKIIVHTLHVKLFLFGCTRNKGIFFFHFKTKGNRHERVDCVGCRRDGSNRRDERREERRTQSGRRKTVGRTTPAVHQGRHDGRVLHLSQRFRTSGEILNYKRIYIIIRLM